MQPKYINLRNVSGAWFITEVSDIGGVPIRLASKYDTTYDQRTEYDPRCGSCWLGHAHSGNLHRDAIKFHTLEAKWAPEAASTETIAERGRKQEAAAQANAT